HRWAAAVVAGGLPKPSALPDDFLGPLPDDDALHTWFVEGHARIVDTLRAADPNLECFTFLADAPPARVFWARRQAQATGRHPAAAESPRGRTNPFSTEVAVDGIDEMLTGFIPRKHTPLHSDQPVTLLVAPDDSDRRWHTTISAEPPATIRETADANCTLRGAASDIYLALWNRGEASRLDIEGDADVLALFCDNVKVRWSCPSFGSAVERVLAGRVIGEILDPVDALDLLDDHRLHAIEHRHAAHRATVTPA